MDAPNTLESVSPCSGQYSFKKDLRLNAWLAVAAATDLPVLWLLKHHPEWSPLARAMLLLAPMIPGLLYIRACLRFIRGMDELQRRVQMEAWLFATLGTLIVSTIVNTLNSMGVGLGTLQHGLGLGSVFTVAFVLWLVGLGIANRRYK